MKCAYCNGKGTVFVVDRFVQGQDYGPSSEGLHEVCPECRGEGFKPDMVYIRSVVLVGGSLFISKDALNPTPRINIGDWVRRSFPEIAKQPLKLKITIEKIEE